jgi:ABC-2 type transport system permease protein
MALRSAESAPLVEGLKRELVKTATLVDLPLGVDSVQDALFFGDVGYVVDVPQGFSKAFMEGRALPMTSHSRPDDQSGRYLEMAIDHYFRLVGLYRSELPQMGEAELVLSVAKNLEEETRVVVHQGPSPVRSMPYARGYFNFMSYSLFNLLILGICALMLVFNQKEIRLRNRCSPISLRRLNGQLFLAYSLICWLVMSALCLLAQRDPLPGANIFLFLLNSLVFTLWAASAAFAMGQFTEKRDALSGMATVVTLVTSFLGGAFVPQEFLSGGLLKFSQFLPTYWYVRANNRIAEIGTLSYGEISPTLQALGMQLLFALAFISVALLVARKARQ